MLSSKKYKIDEMIKKLDANDKDFIVYLRCNKYSKHMGVGDLESVLLSVYLGKWLANPDIICFSDVPFTWFSCLSRALSLILPAANQNQIKEIGISELGLRIKIYCEP